MINISNKVQLYFYDHRPRKYNQKSQTGLVGLLNITRLREEIDISKLIVNSKEDATHLIVHLDDFNRNKKALIGEWPDSSRVNQIVLCLTSVNCFNSDEYPHRISKASNFERVTFFCRDTRPLSRAEVFAQFCNLETEAAKRIAAGDMSILDSGLRRVLFEVSDNYLPALAILCQAYLILHASANPSIVDNNEEIFIALEEISYFDALKTPEKIPLPDNIPHTLNNMSPQWWFEVLMSATSDDRHAKSQTLLSRVKKEWEILRNSSMKDSHRVIGNWQDIEILLAKIARNDGTDTDSSNKDSDRMINPLLVARAHRAIRSVLMLLN